MKQFIKETNKEYKCFCGNISKLNIFQEKIKNKFLITSVCEKCNNTFINHYQEDINKIKINQFIIYLHNKEYHLDKIKNIKENTIETFLSNRKLNINEIEIYIPMPGDWCLFAMNFDEGISSYTLMQYGEQDSIKWDYIIPFIGILPDKL